MQSDAEHGILAFGTRLSAKRVRRIALFVVRTASHNTQEGTREQDRNKDHRPPPWTKHGQGRSRSCHSSHTFFYPARSQQRVNLPVDSLLEIPGQDVGRYELLRQNFASCQHARTWGGIRKQAIADVAASPTVGNPPKKLVCKRLGGYQRMLQTRHPRNRKKRAGVRTLPPFVRRGWRSQNEPLATERKQPSPKRHCFSKSTPSPS